MHHSPWKTLLILSAILLLAAVIFIFFQNIKTAPAPEDTAVQAVVEPAPGSGKGSPCLVAAYFSADEVGPYQAHSPSYLETGEMFPSDFADVLDIVYYAFAKPSSDGTVTLPNTDCLEDCLGLQKNGTRVLVSVSGTSHPDSSAFIDISASEETCKVFAKNLLDLVDQYGMDGVDIDWEAVSSDICPSAAPMNLLMRSIREEMDAREKDTGKEYFLTCAVPCSSWGISEKRFDFQTLNGIVDYINIMSYDLNMDEACTHVSPLYTSEKDNGFGFGAVYGAETLMERGVDESKIIIGCAGYGKAYRVVEPDSSDEYPGLGQAGTPLKLDIKGSYDSGTIFGSAIAEATEQYNLKSYKELDSGGNFVGSWLYGTESGIFITYDSEEAIAQKIAFARSHPGMGIMIWSYTEDTDDHVMNAIVGAEKP